MSVLIFRIGNTYAAPVRQQNRRIVSKTLYDALKSKSVILTIRSTNRKPTNTSSKQVVMLLSFLLRMKRQETSKDMAAMSDLIAFQLFQEEMNGLLE